MIEKKKRVTADDVMKADWKETGNAGNAKVRITFFAAEIGGVTVKASKTVEKATGAKQADYNIGGKHLRTIAEVVDHINTGR